ncbi:hypothetical protein AQUCO_01500188v1 [Aquilegia coerulea]|uniref:Uncharacterized protein n=1 Tax=Aquilegia coerulea TaxID=218851 RepID=A0A2G5DSH7_AQUCA|nr:hypothetical protein AQUCO_01500188v1 [Aquilegia coerulea]
MDREPEEVKLIGFWGTLKETFKIIFTWKKIFTQITLSLILPLTIVFLGYPKLNDYVSRKADKNQDGRQWTIYALLTFLHVMILILLFLLSTAAVVYTIACIYTSKQFTFKRVLSVVPKVWKRLVVTFVVQFLLMLAYNIIALVIFVPLLLVMSGRPAVSIVIIILAIFYIIGFVYINVIWSLANVVSVLEDLKGCGAVKKSKALLKGKMFVASALFVLIYLPLTLVQIGFEVVLDLGSFGIGSKVGIGALCFLLTLVLILLGLVIQTILYFVCKAYHHETIDKSYLANHLEVFMPGYVPLVERNVQLEQSNV